MGDAHKSKRKESSEGNTAIATMGEMSKIDQTAATATPTQPSNAVPPATSRAAFAKSLALKRLDVEERRAAAAESRWVHGRSQRLAGRNEDAHDSRRRSEGQCAWARSGRNSAVAVAATDSFGFVFLLLFLWRAFAGCTGFECRELGSE